MYFRTSDSKPPYRPGIDRKSAYKGVWQKYWHGFKEIYTERFAPVYGALPGEKTLEVSKLLSCGDYRNGFRKHVCPECGTVLIVPFTCKSRLCILFPEKAIRLVDEPIDHHE